jgi:histidine triad (HIT) family protein
MEDCIFCQISQGKAKSWKVYENEYAYAFFDLGPVNKYHTLVVPKKHYKDIFTIPENELREVMAAVKKVAMLYREKWGMENVQIINSSGAEAQQDVFHIHFHIVPRHKGDGQDIRWTPHAELKAVFDELLDRLK